MGDWDLDKKNGSPLYLQIKEEIKEKIRHKLLVEGSKLPTERELAKSLEVSRNTVSAAYKELEAEGILISQQGKGTFVADSGNFYRREGCKERLLKMIDLAMEEAIELGFSLEHFVNITYNRIKEKEHLLSNLQIGFVECNNEQLYTLAHQLELALGVRVIPFLLSDLEEAKDCLKDKLNDIDMLVTTLFHYDETEELVKPAEKQVIALPLNPQLETLIKIAQIPRGTRVGLACFSAIFEARVRNSLASVGITKINILATTAQKEDELRKFLTKVDLVVASPEKKKKIQALIPPQMEIIELVYLPDKGMVSRLKTILLGLKKEWSMH